jgi:hypothetical protein
MQTLEKHFGGAVFATVGIGSDQILALTAHAVELNHTVHVFECGFEDEFAQAGSYLVENHNVPRLVDVRGSVHLLHGDHDARLIK